MKMGLLKPQASFLEMVTKIKLKWDALYESNKVKIL